MDLQAYSKKELGMLYFKNDDPYTASAHLMRWINRNPELVKKLLESGYSKSCKEFTPMQVSYIYYFLGEP